MKDGRFSGTWRAKNFREAPARQASHQFIQSRYAGGNDKRGHRFADLEGRSHASSESGFEVEAERSGGRTHGNGGEVGEFRFAFCSPKADYTALLVICQSLLFRLMACQRPQPGRFRSYTSVSLARTMRCDRAVP